MVPKIINNSKLNSCFLHAQSLLLEIFRSILISQDDTYLIEYCRTLRRSKSVSVIIFSNFETHRFQYLIPSLIWNCFWVLVLTLFHMYDIFGFKCEKFSKQLHLVLRSIMQLGRPHRIHIGRIWTSVPWMCFSKIWRPIANVEILLCYKYRSLSWSVYDTKSFI